MPTIREVEEELGRGPLTAVINKRSLSLWFFGFTFLALLLLAPFILETNDAGWYAVKQTAGTGTLSVFTNPGMFLQAFSEVTYYKAADIIQFFEKDNSAIEVRFNDGAVAKVQGNVRVELPTSPELLAAVHTKFRSYDSLINDTVKQVVSESVILTAALMSAEESYTTKRAEFSQMADDQVRNGIYLTEAESVATKDSKTGELTYKQIVRVQKNKVGEFERKPSVLAQYGIRITQFVIKEIDYEEGVRKQIETKQQALMKTVAAKAEAEKAVQDRLTAEEVGKKNVAVAKYEQEVEKAKAVTSAEKDLRVSELNSQSAENYKRAQILRADGDSEYRRKIMAADGALEKRLDAFVQTQKAWAGAFERASHPVVPQMVFGGASGIATNAAQSLMELLTIKTAKDLQVQINPSNK